MIGSHIQIKHNAERRVVTIEISEEAVMGCYLSGCAFLISGLIAGCTIWQHKAKKTESCACASCRGLYHSSRSLGHGGYGEAMLVQRSGKPYVLKRVGCETINSANAVLHEAACLQKLNHPNVVRFEDVFLHRHNNGGCSVAIVMEFCAGGDLIDRLECSRSERPLSELAVLRFLESLCHALHHVHCNGVLHRDMKSSNIFVCRNDRAVKLGDFGLACSGLPPRRLTGSPRRMSRCGTGMYMAPEVADYKPYGAASDTYGLGCVLLEMMLRHQLRERRPFEERKDYIHEALAAANGHRWDAFGRMSELVWRMLDDNHKTRIALPDAATAAAAAANLLNRQQAVAMQAGAVTNGCSPELAASPNGAHEPVAERLRPAKRVAPEERLRKNAHHERRRRVQYAD